MSQHQPTILNRKTGPLGYGLMGLTWRPQPPSFEDSIPVMKRALELGADNWNGGEFYGESFGSKQMHWSIAWYPT